MAHTFGTSLRIPATSTATTNPATGSFTCGAGTTVMVVMLAYAGSTARGGGAPTYNNLPLTQAGTQQFGTTAPECSAEMWYLLSPPTEGSYSVSVPNSGGLAMATTVATASAASGKISALDISSGRGAVSTNPITNSFTTTVNGDAIFAIVANGAQSWGPTARTGTQINDGDNGAWGSGTQYLMQSTAGSTTIGWTFGTSEDYGIIAVAFKEVTSTQYTQNLSDSITLTDTPLSSASFNLSLTDATTLSDSNSNTSSFNKDLIDAIILSDSNSQVNTFERSLSDSTTLSDSATSSIVLLLSLSDSVILSDNNSSIFTFNITVTDSVALSDSSSTSSAYSKSVSDSIGLSENISLESSFKLSLLDTVVLSDVNLIISEYSKLLSDQLTISDEITLPDTNFTNYTLNLSEYISLSDLRTSAADFKITISDALSLQDSKDVFVSILLSDSITISDEKLAGVLRVIRLSDNIIISDSSISQKSINRTLVDFIELSDDGLYVLTDKKKKPVVVPGTNGVDKKTTYKDVLFSEDRIKQRDQRKFLAKIKKMNLEDNMVFRTIRRYRNNNKFY